VALFDEDFFRSSTGDLRRDVAAAAAEGKVLALWWERDGCPYCAMLHQEALREPALRAYPATRFYTVRLDRYGAGGLIDLDGAAGREGEIAVRHGVAGTPTMEFRLADGREVLRLPGYAEPAILLAAFEYVQFGGWLHVGIVGWLQQRGLL
jgi:thioredoxin-related protein